MRNHSSLEVNHLIVTIAQEGSFSRAARKLHVDQTSITRKVLLLEKSLGTMLFSRTTRRMELTAAGKLYVRESSISLNHAERAWDLARYQALIEHGPFRIGYSPYTHSSFLPVLESFKPSARMPDETSGTYLESAYTLNLVSRVLRGELHAAIGIAPIMDADLWVKSVGRDGHSVGLPKNHRLAVKPMVTVPDLDGEVIYWMPKSMHPDFYKDLATYIDNLGVKPIFREVGNVVHAMEFTARGYGLALLPRSTTRLSRTGTVIKPLSDRYLCIENLLFMRRDQRYDELKEIVDDLLVRLLELKVNIG